jgi:hypothetical protein
VLGVVPRNQHPLQSVTTAVVLTTAAVDLRQANCSLITWRGRLEVYGAVLERQLV